MLLAARAIVFGGVIVAIVAAVVAGLGRPCSGRLISVEAAAAAGGAALHVASLDRERGSGAWVVGPFVVRNDYTAVERRAGSDAFTIEEAGGCGAPVTLFAGPEVGACSLQLDRLEASDAYALSCRPVALGYFRRLPGLDRRVVVSWLILALLACAAASVGMLRLIAAGSARRSAGATTTPGAALHACISGAVAVMFGVLVIVLALA